MIKGACRGTVGQREGDRDRAAPYNPFFPERGQSTADAKVYCQWCPVVSECGSYADKHRIEWGVWGGVYRGRSG